MKHLLMSILLSSLLLPATNSQVVKNFLLKSVTTGTEFNLSRNKGKIIVLHFLLETECPFCLRLTNEYHELFKENADVKQLFIKPDSKEEILKWTEKLPADVKSQMPDVYQDENARLAERYQIPNGYQFHGRTVHYPALIILGKKGEELFRYVGKSNKDRMPVEEFQKKLAELQKK